MGNVKLFESKHIRSMWSDTEQKWLSSVVDVVEVLTDSQNPQVYWRVLKKRLLGSTAAINEQKDNPGDENINT